MKLPEIPHNHTKIDQIVSELRILRLASLENRHRLHNPPKLPSRKNLTHIIERLTAALFPNRLGLPDLTEQGIDFFVGHTLEIVLHDLAIEVSRELNFMAGNEATTPQVSRQTSNIIDAFAKQLPPIRSLLETDICAAYEGDPAAHNIDEILVCYPGITAIIHYRLAHTLYKLELPLIARIISTIAHSLTGIEIHPAAQIGNHFFIDHGTGVVIGETAIIGCKVRLYQAVTLGAKHFPVNEQGTLIKGIPRHPIVEDEVVIYAGATVLGRITIGKNSTIGGNVWLTHSIPPGSHITQAQMRHEKNDA